MPAEAQLAAAVRAELAPLGRISETRMFGGTCFLLDGNMVAAVDRRGLLLRIGKDRDAAALARPGVRPMEMRGRVMAGYVYVDPDQLVGDALAAWLRDAVDFVQTLPPKAASGPQARKGQPT